MEALATELAPTCDRDRRQIAEQLWKPYSLLEDSASFLTATIHWAKRSSGSVTIASMLLPGAPLIYVRFGD